MSKSSNQFFVFLAIGVALLDHTSASGAEPTNQETNRRILTLQETVSTTLARDPQVLIAAAQSLRSREALRETRSLNLPQVVVGTGLAYNNGYPLSMEGAAPSIVQAGVTQAILSKKNSSLIHEAEESGKATRSEGQSVREELAFKTASVYFELDQARKIIQLESERLNSAQKQQQIMESLLGAGKVRPVDLSLAKGETASARQQLLVAQEQAGVAESELRELTGLPDTVSIQTVEPRIDNSLLTLEPETLYQHALECSPEALQAEYNLRSKEFHLEAEKSGSLPKLDIVSQYALFSRANNYADYFNRFNRHNVIIGLSLQVPIFDGYRTGARVAQSRQEVTEARYRRDYLRRDLKINIWRGLSALRVAQGDLELANVNVKTAREVVEVNQTLLEEGRISPKEMEESLSQLHQRELAQFGADRTLFQRKLDLLRTVGSLESAIQ
jgi:outer membrane protein